MGINKEAFKEASRTEEAEEITLSSVLGSWDGRGHSEHLSEPESSCDSSYLQVGDSSRHGQPMAWLSSRQQWQCGTDAVTSVDPRLFQNPWITEASSGHKGRWATATNLSTVTCKWHI